MTYPRSERVRPCHPSCAPRSHLSSLLSSSVKHWGALVVTLWCASVACAQPRYDLQRAIDAVLAPANSSGYRVARASVEIPNSVVVSATVNVRNTYGLHLSAAPGVTVTSRIWNPSGVVFDFTGSVDLTVEDVRLVSEAWVGAGFFSARREDGASANRHRFLNCTVTGVYTQGGLVNAGAELFVARDCFFSSDGPTPAVLITNRANRLTVPHMGRTCQQILFDNCHFSSGTEVNAPIVRILLEGQSIISDITFRGGGIGTEGHIREAGLVIEQIGQPGQVQDIHISGMRWETDTCNSAISVKGDGSSLSRLTLRDSTINACGPIVFAPGQYLRGCEASGLNAVACGVYRQQPVRYAVVGADAQSQVAGIVTGTNDYQYNATLGIRAATVGDQPR